MNIAECYRLLELPATANLHEVKSSYRRLARQWHPDVNPDNNEAHDMFIRVTQAYKVLLKVSPPAPKTTAKSPSPQTTPTASPPVDPSPTKVKVTVRHSQPQPQSQPTHTSSPPVNPSPSKVKVSRKPAPGRNSSKPRPEANSRASTQARSGKGAAGQNRSTAQSRHRNPYVQTQSTGLTNQKLKYDSYRQLQTLIKHNRFPRAIALVEALRQRLPQDLEVRQWQAIIYQSWGRQLIRERRLEQARAYLKKALNTDPHNKSLWAEVERDFQTLEKVY